MQIVVLFLALAGCGGHCAAMIVQQSGSFIRVAFSLRFSGFWHLRLTAPDSLKGPLPWCECETKFRSSWRISVQFSGDSGLVSDGNSDTSWSSTYMPGRAVGVDALSCLHLCPREFAADKDESARKGNFAVLALHRGFWSHSARRRLDKCSNKLRGLGHYLRGEMTSRKGLRILRPAWSLKILRSTTSFTTRSTWLAQRAWTAWKSTLSSPRSFFSLPRKSRSDRASFRVCRKS